MMTAARNDLPDRFLIVAIDDSEDATEAVRAGHELATGCAAAWQAFHVETPENGSPNAHERIAEAFALATSLGATVATIPAVNVAEGLITQIEEQGATDLVMGRSRRARLFSLRPRAVDEIAARCDELRLHILPRSTTQSRTMRRVHVGAAKGSPRSYGVTLLLVLVALAVAVAIGHWFGPRGLDLFFLFPVIAAAVKFGIRQSLLATILSVLFHNLFFIQPLMQLNPSAGQSILMAAGLSAVGVYTSMIAEQLRGRLRLSDRSAKENSAIVTFAQELARADNWDATARIVSQTFSAILGTRSTILREKDGQIVVVASEPTTPVFGLLDQIARDWAWKNAEQAGRGTNQMAAADWRFVPLETDLGVLALVGIARDDGGDPAPPNRAVLLATLASLAALAHERLRLEDLTVERAVREA